MNKLNAIRQFFEPPTVTMAELKALSSEQRNELAELVFEQTGWPRD